MTNIEVREKPSHSAIKRKQGQPAYSLLRKHFQEHINTGRWAINRKIPTESELAKQYQVSRDTVRRALKELEKKGILIAEQGSGRTVAREIISEKQKNSKVRKGIIGLITTPRHTSDKYGSYADIPAIEDVLIRENYDMLMYSVANTGQEILDDTINRISWNEIDGVIIYCQQISKEKVPEFNNILPTVSMYHRCASFGIPSFYIAWNWISYMASKHLFEQGYDNQLLLVSNRSYFMDVDSQLIEGFKFAHVEHSIPFDKDSIDMVPANNKFSKDDIAKMCDKIKIRHKSGRLGIISYYTWPSIEISKELTPNLKIPRDIGLISLIQGIETDSIIPTTTFEYDRDQMGRSAVKCLINSIEGNGQNNILNLDNPFYGKLIAKESTNA